MPPRKDIGGLGAALVLSLLIPEGCTDNPATRELETNPATQAGAGQPGSGGAATSGGGGATTGGTAGSESGGTAGTTAGSGGTGADPCLPECEDPAGCELDAVQQAEVDFCHLYALHCPDQPPDVMMERTEEPIAAGPDASSTATRPQLTEEVADELYTIEEAFRGGGVYTVTYSGPGDTTGAGGEGGETGAGGETGVGGEVGEAGAGGQSGAATANSQVGDAGAGGDPGTGGAGGEPSAGGEGGELGAGGEAGSGPSGPLGERTVSYEFDEPWDPGGPIEDVTKIVPGLVVDPNGDPDVDGTYTTVQSAISAAVLVAGCPRVFIQVMPGTYREKITVPAKTSSPPVTLYSADSDPSRVVIVAGHSAAGAENDGTPLTIHQSATFTNSLPQPFQARNLTIANDYVEGTYPGDPEDQTAVALLTQADQAMFDNVRILGHRNALYIKSTGANEASRVYFRDCVIEGDEDIILGRGAAVIDQCRIHSLGDRVSTGAIVAASTRVDNPHGVLIINSQLDSDAIVSNVYLGHQWYEGEEDEAVGKTIVRNSILGAHIRKDDPWQPTLRATPLDPSASEPSVLYTSDDYYAPMTGLIPPEVYLAEFGNSGPGAALSE